MKTQTRIQYRQGDVLIEKIAQLPQGFQEEPRDKGRVILAYGEVTSHAHAIKARKVVKSPYRQETALNAPIQVSELEIQQALAALEHEEHATITLERGSYRVIRQREYSPEAIRNVID